MMKKARKSLSLPTKVFWERIVVGVLWLCIWCLGFFRHIPVIDGIHLILLFAVVGLQLVMLIFPGDPYDEMALDNLKTAKAKTLDILSILFLFFMGAWSVLDNHLPELAAKLISLELIFLFMGIQGLISGLIFRKLEAS